jgi:diguanylate cyclase (GGDEF)-like protein
VLKRAAWEEELARELTRAKRDKRELCVVMLDVDHFKRFNDAHGHPAGDQLLRDAALAWRSELRLTDQLGRYGGDEFVLLLPGCTIENGRSLVERLSAVTAAGQTCSGGLASWNGEEDANELVSRADVALFEAKQLGRNQVATAAWAPGPARPTSGEEAIHSVRTS